MDKIKEFFIELKKNYPCNITFCSDNVCEKELEKVPAALHDFYKTVSEAELPFGRIFSLETALKESTSFPADWFFFGQDNYFSFWLCSYHPDTEGLSFTSWDHEAHTEIEAVDKDILSFLQYELEDYQENEGI